MKNTEAIKLIQGIEEDGRNVTSEHVEALNLAIKALEQPQDDLISREDLKKALEVTQYNDIDDLTRTERLIASAPTVELTEQCKGCQYLKDCETCKDRQDAEYIRYSSSWHELQALRKFKAENERLKGEWIPCTKSGMPLTEQGRLSGEKWYGFKCSNPECNYIYKGNALTESTFCQKCGADMRGGAE